MRRVLALILPALVLAAGGAGATELQAPRLTTTIPPKVARTCAQARPRSPIRLVCPPLVPVSGYRRYPGVSGFELGTDGLPSPPPPADRFYSLGFNAGDGGPVCWHWIAGMGTAAAISWFVLSDARNVVKGKPRLLDTISVAGRRVAIWRFPDYPAGGPFGGHDVAITASGRYYAFASVHGHLGGVSARMAAALARKADALR